MFDFLIQYLYNIFIMKVVLGKIVKPQGCNGEMKIYPADTEVSIYKNVKNVYIGNEKIKVTRLAIRQDFLYLTIPTVKDRNVAETYRGKQVFVDEEELALKENTYLTEDMMSADVVDENGEFIGNIVDVESYGSADVLTILEDKREYKIPFLTSIVTKVTKEKVVLNRDKYDEVKICE